MTRPGTPLRVGPERAAVLAALFADRSLPESAKTAGAAVLLYLTGDDLHVALDRAAIGDMLGGMFRSRVDERLRALRAGGWLVTVSRPAPGRPAVWRWAPPAERAPEFPVRERAPGHGGHVSTALAPDFPVRVSTARTPENPVHVESGEPGHPGLRAPEIPVHVSLGDLTALPDHHQNPGPFSTSNGSIRLSLPTGNATTERDAPSPHAKINVLVRSAQQDMTEDEADRIVNDVRSGGRVASLTAWAGSVRGQDDIRDRLATHRAAHRPLQPAAAACPVCVAGWVGEDDDDRPIPCPACKPHAARTR